MGRGSPIHNVFSFTPVLFHDQNKVGGKIEKLKKWSGVLGTTETNTKVPAPSGLIDERQIRSLAHHANFANVNPEYTSCANSFKPTSPLRNWFSQYWMLESVISAQKMWFAPKISSDIWSAAGDLFTWPRQSLPEMSDSHWGAVLIATCKKYWRAGTSQQSGHVFLEERLRTRKKLFQWVSKACWVDVFV